MCDAAGFLHRTIDAPEESTCDLGQRAVHVNSEGNHDQDPSFKAQTWRGCLPLVMLFDGQTEVLYLKIFQCVPCLRFDLLGVAMASVCWLRVDIHCPFEMCQLHHTPSPPTLLRDDIAAAV